MKPDAETIIAQALHAAEETGKSWRQLAPASRTFYLRFAGELLSALRANGYSLIHGADHKFLKED